jgi:hypothetical protein
MSASGAHLTLYELKITTDTTKHAGTESEIHARVAGEYFVTDWHKLDHPGQ